LIAEQTRITLSNLASILEAAQSDLNHVLKTTVYLTVITTFNEMKAAYAKFFQDPYPTRATIVEEGIFGGLGVEIDLIAMKNPDRSTDSLISKCSKNY
jgi:2-iminobutanoate/2-iminopropanoate deaminase